MGDMKRVENLKKVVYRIAACWICLLGILILGGAATANGLEKEEKRVLFISSYSYAWETVPEQIEGIQSVFNDFVNLDYKFMDTKNSFSKEGEELFYQSMKQYLSEVPAYDAVIVGDDAAFQFALTYQQELFRGIPIAFEGVNAVEAAEEACKNPLITGVIEKLSYENTITLAKKLYPDAKQIVAVLDDTITGEGERKEFYKYDKKFKDLKFTEMNVSSMTQKEIKTKLSSLDKDSILLYIMCSEDADGHHYIGSQGIRFISSSAPIPTFSIVSIGMGHGFLGGEIVSQKEMGKIAAEMVKQYFDGKDFSSIRLVKDTPRGYRFDQTVMDRHGIKASDLPAHSEIINHTPTFYEKNIAMIRISIVIGIILILIVMVLLLDNLRRRRLNHALDQSRHFLLKTVQYDQLTGIYNRSVFMDVLSKKIAEKERFAVVLYDIDHFKNINDTLGHNTGDIVLKEMAERANSLCDNKFTVYRLAGDEFTAIIMSEDTNEVKQYVEKLQEVFRQPIVLEHKEYRIHCSIGVALYPEDASNQTDLIAAADKAMYRVKNNGRNAYCFYHGEEIIGE